MITKLEYLLQIRTKFAKKISINFWAEILWNLLEKKEITLEEVWKSLEDVNINQT